MKRLSVLTSNAGMGTNLQAIIDAIKNKSLNARISVVISSNKDAYGLQRAKRANIPIRICQKKENLLPILRKNKPDFICLAGWTQIIPDAVLDHFSNKILNLHPGLIPDKLGGIVKNPDGTNALWNRGKMTSTAVKNFLDKKNTYAGSCVHFLSHEFDFGKVLGRTFEKIKKRETVDSLYARLKKKENKLYVEVLQQLCND